MDDILIIRQPKTEQEFDSMEDLIWKVLKKPWNQPRESEELQNKENVYCFIALLNDEVVGAAHFYKIRDNIGQIKNFVVLEKLRRKKIGTNMIQAIHMTARNQRMKYIVLNAREESKEFFEKFTYQLVDEGPIIFDQIKQYKMIKQFRK